jgi:glutathione S-transferase
VADQVPNKNLAPANGTLPRYRLQEWLTFIGTEIHKTFSPLFNPATPEDAKAMFRDKLASRFEFVDRQLEGKEYVMGDHFSVADAYLYVVTRWTKPMNIDIARFKNLSAHNARVEARPAVQEALKVEKLS